MRLQTKLIVTNILLFLIAISFIGVLLFSNSRTNLEEQIINQLSSTSNTIDENIRAFVQAQTDKIELIAIQSALSNEELIEMAKRDPSFYDFFVIGENGTVTSASNIDKVGAYGGDKPYFINARNQTYVRPVYLATEPVDYFIAFATPFHDGVLVGRVSIDYLNNFVKIKEGLGKTGENLMAFVDNESIIYFTPRLFSNISREVLTKEKAKDRPIYRAIIGKEEVFSGAKDYRNVEVLASTRYIEEIKVGLVSKIDASEAFSKVEALQRMTIYLIIVILLVMSFAIYIVSRKISMEINDISSNIVKITKGNLNIQLKKSSLTEVQVLIDSLNRILASMKLAILRTGISKGELGIGEAVKAKEEAEERYKVLYESASDAIMTLEPPSWKFSAGNPATLKMFNIKDEKELQSLGPWDVSPEKQPDGHLSSVDAKKMIEKAMKGGSNYFEWTHRRYRGENFPATVLLTRVKLGEKLFLQATVRDMSKEKKVEEELNLLKGRTKIRELLGDNEKKRKGGQNERRTD
jgi:PAS domain S-box-containing protein